MALAFITAVTLTAGSSSVLADDTSTTASSTTSSSTTTDAKDFQEHKTKILKHISDRLTKIQQIQACVQAANDPQSMKACKPHRHKHHDHDTNG